MVAAYPRGIYRMTDRMSIIRENTKTYRRGTKKTKTEMLDELTRVLGMNRKYLAFLLRNAGKKIYTDKGVRIIADPRVSYLARRGRKRIYTDEILPYLTRIWILSGYISSVHLVVFLRLNQDKIFQHPKLRKAPADIKAKLLRISHATIDRLLRPTREKFLLKGRYKSNPHSSRIKKAVPIQAYYDKPVGRFGYTEIDLVHHCGETTAGEFAFTLSATEIVTGWTELRSIKNKARVWTLQALRDIDESVPFQISDLHSDNGSEFINAHVVNFARERDIPFTRSRAYKKNDAPFVESKNWTMVRQYTGYCRYDTDRELAILEQMMRLVSLKHNYFIPTMKLVHKRRDGARVRKKYTIDTPLRRVLASAKITKAEKNQLSATRDSIDLLKLISQIEALQDKLEQAYRHKYNRGRGRKRCA